MNKMPLVSFLVPVYNAEEYLEESILSITSQSYKNIEIIIINDGSTDGTLSILDNYKNDSRFLIVNQENSGIVSALNNGISLSSGSYIARMDSDDISHPERIKMQVEFLENNSDYILCGSYVEYFGNEERLIKFPVSDSVIKSELFFRSSLCHPAVMIRSSALINLSYEQDYLYAEDYRLWTLLTKKGKFYNLPFALLKYRVHANQTSELKKDAQRKAHVNVSKNYISTFGMNIDENSLSHLLFQRSPIKFSFYFIKSFKLLFVLPRKESILVPLKMFVRRFI